MMTSFGQPLLSLDYWKSALRLSEHLMVLLTKEWRLATYHTVEWSKSCRGVD